LLLGSESKEDGMKDEDNTEGEKNEMSVGGIEARERGKKERRRKEDCVAPTVLETLGIGTQRLRAGLICGAPLALGMVEGGGERVGEKRGEKRKSEWSREKKEDEKRKEKRREE
jgi:hypothetical protein